MLFFIKGLHCGLYYKPMTIINEDSRVVNKLKTSLTDEARVVIYDRHIFIVQATDCFPEKSNNSNFIRLSNLDTFVSCVYFVWRLLVGRQLADRHFIAMQTLQKEMTGLLTFAQMTAIVASNKHC